ncbi:hypothetical protein F4779DRAFT_569325 [Xylariaceae sp. FL0662B]|nr:hypothetical protein F4779DRAFT_569325 [Xylariaceae sp. FL0662B]
MRPEPVGDRAGVGSNENLVCCCGLEMKLRSITDRKNSRFGKQLWLCPKEKDDPTQCKAKRLIDIEVRDEQQVQEHPSDPQTPESLKQKRMDSFLTPSTRSNRKQAKPEDEQGGQSRSGIKRPSTPSPVNRQSQSAKKSKTDTDTSLLQTPDSMRSRQNLAEPFRDKEMDESPCPKRRMRDIDTSDSSSTKNAQSATCEDTMPRVARSETRGDMLRIGSQVVPISDEVRAFLKATLEAFSASEVN